MDLFDTSLGTLDSVGVSISSRVQFTGLLPQNLVPSGSTVVPLSYTVFGQFQLQFSGLGPMPSPQWLMAATNPGAGAIPVLASWDLQYDFVYDGPRRKALGGGRERTSDDYERFSSAERMAERR